MSVLITVKTNPFTPYCEPVSESIKEGPLSGMGLILSTVSVMEMVSVIHICKKILSTVMSKVNNI